MSQIAEMIDNLVESRFTIDGDHVVQYNEDVSMADAIDELLAGLPNPVFYEIESTDCFDSPGYDTGVISVAWFEPETQYMGLVTYQWEGY